MSSKRLWTKSTSADEYYGNKRMCVGPPPAKTYRKARPNAKMSSAMVQQVKRLVNQTRETKYLTQWNIEQSINTNWATPYVLPITLSPSQGSQSNQRVGNKISPVGFKFSAVLHNNSSQTVMVRLLIMQIMDGKTSDSNVCNTLFEGAGGQDVTPTPTMISLIRKVNREEFIVLKDDIIALGYDAAGYSSPNPRVVAYKHYAKLSGEQTFHDINDELPENDRIVVVLLPVRADGDESLGESVEISYTSDFYYKD